MDVLASVAVARRSRQHDEVLGEPCALAKKFDGVRLLFRGGRLRRYLKRLVSRSAWMHLSLGRIADMVSCHLGLSGGLGNCNEALLGEFVSVLCETADMGENKFLFASNDFVDGCQGVQRN